MQAGSLPLAGKPPGQQGSPGKFPRHAENRGDITVTNIPFGTHTIATARGFTQMITVGNPAVLSPAAMRAPATVRHIIGNGPVKRGAVRAALPAGNDTLNQHAAKLVGFIVDCIR